MRTINWDEPLCEDDKAWALQRDLQDKVAANEARFAHADTDLANTDETTGDEDTDPDEESGEEPEEPTSDDEEEPPAPDDDYPSWKLQELRGEAETRKPPVSHTGLKKPELIEALRKWDREYPDAE